MESRIKNLIFDIGGVIILRKKVDFSKFEEEFSLSKERIENIVKICFKEKMINKDFEERNFFKENFSHLLGWKDYRRILRKIYGGETANKTLLNWIQGKKKKYKIFLLTNNTIALRFLLKEKFKIDHLFDFVFNSAKIGLAKPDPKLFEYLLEKAGVDPQECLFVDDNLKNIEAAKNIGFLTILFENNKKFLSKVQELGI